MKWDIKYRAFAVFCLLIMSCYVFRPVLPYMEYMINKNYISTHLCVQKDIPNNSCHGHCYLHKQIEKSQHEDNKPDQNNKRDNNQNNKFDDHIASGDIPQTPIAISMASLLIADFPLTGLFADAVFVPPKH